MEFITNNLPTILTVLGLAYPPLLFLLPPAVATKIDIGIKVIKTIADTLEKAKQTKGGFSIETGLSKDIKKTIQKSR